MSKKPNATAAAVRAALLDSTAFTGRRDGKGLRTPAERAAGGELKGYSVLEDLRAVVTPLLHLQLSSRCHRAIERAYSDPTIRILERLERLLDAEGARTDLQPGVGRSIREASGALVYHRAELGCSTARAVIAARALAAATLFIETNEHLDRAVILMRHAIFRAEEAQYAEPEPQPGPIYPHVEGRPLQAEAWVHAWTTIGSALRMIEDEEAILRGGAGQQAELPVVQDGDLALDFGLPDVPAGELSAEEILAVAQARQILDAGAARRAAAAPPSLVVVPSLDHLPAPSKTAQDRRDTPRAEYDAIAAKPLPLRPAPDPHAFVEAGVARFPWAREILEAIAQDLVGARFAWLRPTLLLGAPGSGKTALARWIASYLGLDFTLYGVGGSADASFGSTSRQWSTGRASVPLQAIRRAGYANVVICLDEIEKASADRRNGAFADCALGYLEKASASALFDSYLECPVNLSPVTYLATANELAGVPGPLRDRLRVLRVPLPRAVDLPVIAAALVAEVREERGLSADWMPDLSPEELALVARHFRGGSLRPLRRLVETVLAGRESLAPRH